MITLETGLPGAGKTLYCVDKLLRVLVGSEVKSVDDTTGLEVITKRVIYSNINGLLFDHEKIGPGAEWSHDAKTNTWTQPFGGDTHGLNNWHEWAKPGSIVVYDEIQKPWPKVAVGSKVPPCITALETHRHMGVDFICLTQHPMLIHGNLVQLVGRHLHVRRMANMGLAVVYEWDGCSKTLLYKNALSKSALRYSKDAFALYKSSELHTKTPRKIPTLVFGAIFGLVAMFGLAPSVWSRIGDRISPPPKLVVVPKPAPALLAPTLPDAVLAAAGGPSGGLVGGVSIGVTSASSADRPLSNASTSMASFSGCARVRMVCKCYDTDGLAFEKTPEFCAELTRPLTVASGVKEFIASVSDSSVAVSSTVDYDMIAAAQHNKKPVFALR